jgi:putative aminopeptidase FrvX
MFDLLKTLCELPGPGGDEGMVQTFVAERWRPRAKQLQITRVGNVVAHIGGEGPRLMLAAHADEICFVVKHISGDGFVWITTGQRDTEQRPGSSFLPFGVPALILTARGPVEGVFARLTGHVMNADQRAKTKLDWNDIFVDIGARECSEAEARGVQVGDRVIWNPPTRQMGQLVYGKAIDDRVGLAIMDRLLDVVNLDRLAYDLTFAATVQEEIGLIGAESAAREAGCELGIVVDIGLAGDVPGVDPRDISARLGSGPVLVHKDLYAYSRSLTLALARTAKATGIPIQPAVLGLAASDAGTLTRMGMQAALLGVPVRYTHSPFEMVHLDDVHGAVQLLKAFLETRAV